MDVIYLNKGREKPIEHKNLWIFSGAIKKWPEMFVNGDLAQVRSSDNKILGYAYFNRETNIAGRMISFSNKDIDPISDLRKNVRSAVNLRLELFHQSKSKENQTNAYRVINGEADNVPGIIVDRYNDVLVIQVSTLGMEKLKSHVTNEIMTVLNTFGKKDDNNASRIRLVYEKSSMPSRKIEGLHEVEYTVWRNRNIPLAKEHLYKTIVKENGVKFEIDFKNSHKTGFYLDQRNMRELIGSLSEGRKVMNCFSYTGGFSVYSALNNAKSVISVDISEEVINQAKANFKLNKLKPDAKKFKFVAEDVFKYLEKQKEISSDIVILDPPAFAKKKADKGAALSGYKRLNTEALRKMKSGSFLLTCSCSYHVDEESFFKAILLSAARADRKVRILSKHRFALDHTLNVFHPDMDYLKSYLLWVE